MSLAGIPPAHGLLVIGREGVTRLSEHGGRTFWLIYRPDLDWLKSGAAALSSLSTWVAWACRSQCAETGNA